MQLGWLTCIWLDDLDRCALSPASALTLSGHVDDCAQGKSSVPSLAEAIGWLSSFESSKGRGWQDSAAEQRAAARLFQNAGCTRLWAAANAWPRSSLQCSEAADGVPHWCLSSWPAAGNCSLAHILSSAAVAC